MDKAAARREACFRAAMVIEDALRQGWPDESFYPDADDQADVVAALNAVAADLYRRAVQPRPTVEQWAALDWAARHDGTVTEERGRGATRRLPGLRRRWWVDARGNLTPAGRFVAELWTHDEKTGELRRATP